MYTKKKYQDFSSRLKKSCKKHTFWNYWKNVAKHYILFSVEKSYLSLDITINSLHQYHTVTKSLNPFFPFFLRICTVLCFLFLFAVQFGFFSSTSGRKLFFFLFVCFLDVEMFSEKIFFYVYHRFCVESQIKPPKTKVSKNNLEIQNIFPAKLSFLFRFFFLSFEEKQDKK